MTETKAMRGGVLLNDLLARVADVGRQLNLVSAPEGADPAEAAAALCEKLMSGRGEASGLAQARRVLDMAAAMDAAAKARFFRLLADRFGVDRKALQAAADRWRDAPGDETARALHEAAEPRSQQLIRLLNRAPGGARELVALRADLLRAMRGDKALKGLDADFQHLFGSWFNRGFLELRRIDWNSPAAVLEKIIAYEAVHEINGWDDLRRRVAAPDRRLYAFHHPAMGHDPLIFVEVALTAEIPAAIGPVLAENRTPLDPRAAKTAVFYSISNCHEGLRGVSFGNFLIKQVVEELRAEFPALQTFVTLSPVPGLRAWAAAEAEIGRLSPDDGALVKALDAALALPEAARWGVLAERADALAGLAARYLIDGKSPRGGPVDPVARFHLGNGARLERINPCADRSAAGLKASWGLMVNYLYDLDRIEKNHEAFAADGTVICPPAVKRLARPR